MPEKKPNVLTQILYALTQKKQPSDDIVALADKIIEDYIFNKNILIHRKCKRKNRSGVLLALTTAAAMCVLFAIFKLIQ